MRNPVGFCAAVCILWSTTASAQPNCLIPSILDNAPSVGILPDQIFINIADSTATATDIRGAARSWEACSSRPTVTFTNTSNPTGQGTFETWKIKVDTYANLGDSSGSGRCGLTIFASKTINIYSDRNPFLCPNPDETQRIIQHELGHVFRLGDVSSSACRDGSPCVGDDEHP